MRHPIIHFDHGFQTRLPDHKRLAAMLEELGSPTTIHNGAYTVELTWGPFYPGVPDPVYHLGRPWPTEVPRRRVVAVTLSEDK